jgi:hypothetical protein
VVLCAEGRKGRKRNVKEGRKEGYQGRNKERGEGRK